MSRETARAASPLDIALVGVYIAQLAIAVLGVLVISAEYSTGSIRSTFTAVPKRLPVLWAKLVDYAARLARRDGAGACSSASSRPRRSSATSRSCRSRSPHPGIARCVLMGAVYVTHGRDLRARARRDRPQHGGRDRARSPASSSSFRRSMLTLPSSWNNAIRQYLPSEAGRQIFALNHGAAHADAARRRPRLRRVLRRRDRDRGRPPPPPRRLASPPWTSSTRCRRRARSTACPESRSACSRTASSGTRRTA